MPLTPRKEKPIKPIAGSVNDELKTIHPTDFLECQSCGKVVWYWQFDKQQIWWSDITAAYFRHAKKCFGLKRVIAADRENNFD